jgi:hypothetical protein
MGKRLSDTAAIKAMATPTGSESSRSTSVRQIENGYLVSESSWGPGQEYKSREYFSKNPPNEGKADRMVGSENLRGAIGLLKE